VETLLELPHRTQQRSKAWNFGSEVDALLLSSGGCWPLGKERAFS